MCPAPRAPPPPPPPPAYLASAPILPAPRLASPHSLGVSPSLSLQGQIGDALAGLGVFQSQTAGQT